MPPPPPPPRMPIDEGYAWVVCAASSVAFFVTMGVPKSLGVMLLEFQDHFNSDPGLTSLTVALIVAGFFMFVFVSNTLGFIFGNRIVAICGAILAFLSMLITAFAPNIIFVVIFLGLFSGMAYSALFGPPLVILSSYFKERRALATGLALGGGSIGQLVIPLLFNFLVEYYGFQGGMMIFSAVLLHAVPACMMLRPPVWWHRPPKQPKGAKDAESTGDTEPAEPPKPNCCTLFKGALKIMLDKELFKSHVFQMLVFSIVLAHMGYFASVIFLPSAANQFFNNRTMSVILVSVMGVCDLAGRLLGGFIADRRIIPINDLMGISLVVPGVVVVLTGIFPSVWLCFVAAIFLGCFAGSYTALLTPIIIEYFGLAKVSPGFGIITFLMGFFMAPWPTVLAMVFKATGTFKTVLVIAGAVCASGGISFFMMRFILKSERKKTEKKKKKEEETNNSDLEPEDEPDNNRNDVNKNDVTISGSLSRSRTSVDRHSLLASGDEVEAMEAVV